jgi:hypothetical protein
MSISPRMHEWLDRFINNRFHTLRLIKETNIPSFAVMGWSPATLRNYRGSLHRFNHFCQSQNITFSPSCSVSESGISLFIISLTGRRSGSYIRNEINAIRGFHIIYNLPFPRSERISLLLRAADRSTPSTSIRKPREGLSISMLEFLHSNLDLSSPFDTCCFALACCAFWGQARLGELIATNWAKCPHLRDLLDPVSASGSRVLFLPWTKTTGFNGAELCLCRQYGCTDPINALSIHIATNNPVSGPLFSYRLGNTLKTLTRAKFLSRITSILSHGGFAHITGHSFRIGGTTELLLRRIDPSVVRVMGRWSSDAFLRYWRQTSILGPLYVEYSSRAHAA